MNVHIVNVIKNSFVLLTDVASCNTVFTVKLL